MDNDEKQQLARLTEEETTFIELFRNLAESKKEELTELINEFVYNPKDLK